jgi:proteasome lid subunit RPN8/RPN11
LRPAKFTCAESALRFSQLDGTIGTDIRAAADGVIVSTPLGSIPASEGFGAVSMPFRLQLQRRTLEEMIAHARAELPNECVGLLAGVIEDGVGKVGRRYELVNAAASPREFLSQPESMFAAYRDMHGRGLEILAVYHSHPTSDPIPSRTDLERNYSAEVLNFIISLKHDPPLLRGWWLSENSYREVDWYWVLND